MSHPEITDDLLDRALAAYWGQPVPAPKASADLTHTMRRTMRGCLEAVISDLVAVAEADGGRIRLRKTLSGPAEKARQVADELNELLGGTP